MKRMVLIMTRIGLLLLFELIAARYLGSSQYGQFTLGFTVIVVLSSLPVLGLQNSIRRFISFHLEREERDCVNALTLFGMAWPLVSGFLLGGLLFVFARPLGKAVSGNAELSVLLIALALVVPVMSVRRMATVIYSGYRKTMSKVLVEDFTEPLLRVGAVILIAVLGLGVLELAYATVAAYVLTGALAVLLVERCRRDILGAARGFELPLRELLVFSGPLVVSEFAEIILAWVNILMLGFLSVDREVGLFRAVSQPPMLASAILTSFAFIYLPIATELFAKGDYRGWQRTNNAIVRWTVSLAFPVGVVCMAVPAEVIRVLFGEAYAGGEPAMRLLGVAYLFHAACGFTGLNLIVAGRTRLQMIGALAGLGTNVLFSYLWIPEFGATGAAAAMLVSIVVRNVYNLVLMRMLLGIVPFDGKYWRVMASQAASAFVLLGVVALGGLNGFVAVVLVAGLQLPLSVAIGLRTGVFGRADLEWLMSLVRRRLGSRDAS